MLDFFSKRPGLGIEITSSAVRLAALSGNGAGASVLFTQTVHLPAGMVSESYAAPNVCKADDLSALLRESLSSISALHVRRAALSLPDAVFRVQSIEFDDLPGKAGDRERIIRWRIEKSAFDISDAILRYQVHKRKQGGFTVLACVAKQAVIAQYEAVLAGLGLEPWSVGLSSFHALNFYSSYLSKISPVAALAHVTEDSFATIIAETGSARFYRFKEIKRGRAGEINARFMREIVDSLHFYMHMDRSQPAGVERLYLTGDAAVARGLSEGLQSMTSIAVEVLSPAAVIPSVNGAGPELAAALGAGCGL
jgi:Tfp pilus assembly PilM family ATPase